MRANTRKGIFWQNFFRDVKFWQKKNLQKSEGFEVLLLYNYFVQVLLY